MWYDVPNSWAETWNALEPNLKLWRGTGTTVQGGG